MKPRKPQETVETAERARQLFSRVSIPRVSVMSELTARTKAASHERVFTKMRAIYSRRK